MPSWTAELDPADAAGLDRALDRIAALPDRIMLEQFAEATVRVVAEYPPAPLFGARTGRLGRSWWHEVAGLDVGIGNVAPYAEYVHGEAQRDYHAARGWRKLFDVALGELDNLVRRVADRAAQIWSD